MDEQPQDARLQLQEILNWRSLQLGTGEYCKFIILLLFSYIFFLNYYVVVPLLLLYILCKPVLYIGLIIVRRVNFHVITKMMMIINRSEIRDLNECLLLLLITSQFLLSHKYLVYLLTAIKTYILSVSFELRICWLLIYQSSELFVQVPGT